MAGLDDRFYAQDILILYLSGDVYDIVSKDKVFFDMRAEGFQTLQHWPAGNVGILALDLNGNGTIDSGRELFGSNTQVPSSTPQKSLSDPAEKSKKAKTKSKKAKTAKTAKKQKKEKGEKEEKASSKDAKNAKNAPDGAGQAKQAG